MSSIIFPRPFAIAIDDLGWMQGSNEGEDGYGPYRLGLKRKMTLKDYKAAVTLATKTGVRLQGLFILSEMDRENFLGEFPTTTFMREKWDNSENISPLQLEIMAYVMKEAAHLEFGMHGIGHEYWPGAGKRKRAEWYNTDNNHPWPEEEVRVHLDCFIRIMKQYGLTKENGHSFPQSFVPCAYSYYWNPTGSYSLGKVLGEYGVKFANTDFSQIPECNPPKEDNGGGFDHLVHVMNRYNYGNLWYELGKLPLVPLKEQPTDYIETHWPNLLAQDDLSQEVVTNSWISYFEQVQSSPNRYCAKNTAQMHSQWYYNRHTQITEENPGMIEINNTSIPADRFRDNFPGNLVLKLKLTEDQHLTMAKINGETIPAYFESCGYGFLYLPPLLQKKYFLEYKVGKNLIQNTVWHDGTSNIFSVKRQDNEVKIDLCLYGHQTLKFLNANKPIEVKSEKQSLKIIDWKVKEGTLEINLLAKDMQGENGTIRIIY